MENHSPSQKHISKSQKDDLGFQITRDGIKPQPDKVQSILNMKRPATQKEDCRFIGMVNFYRDSYPKRATALAPLIDLWGQKKQFLWKDEKEQAFLKIKDLMAQDAMLTYPQFDKPFIVYTEASESNLVE